MNQAKKTSQESDIKFPNPPADSISSISCNGSAQSPTNMVVATAWDGTVNCYELSWSQGQLSNIVPQSQIKHDAPALCSDISSVSVWVCGRKCVRVCTYSGCAGDQCAY
jgi:hypothetical protein